MNAPEQILQYVSHGWEEAKKAEKVYDDAADWIQFKSSSTISLNSGNAVSRVAEIASLTRNANEEMYTSYQSLVRYLDEKCRPLLTEGADVHSVKELLELIKWLNSESNISSNFSASLNGTDYGDMFNVQYSPTVENRMIQKYWETTYSAMPGAAEENAAYAKRKEAERQTEIEERRRRSELERKRQMEEWEAARREEEATQRKRNTEELDLNAKLEELRPLYAAADKIISVGSYLLDAAAMAIQKNDKIFVKCTDNNKLAAVSSWNNAIQILTTGAGAVGLFSDGSVRICGDLTAHGMAVAAGWGNVKKIAMGDEFIVGLRNDGRVYITGESSKGHPNSTVKGPVYWEDIDDIYCGENIVIGKKKDGSLVAVEYNYYGRSDACHIPQTWADCLDISITESGNYGAIALMKDGKAAIWGKVSDPAALNHHAGIVKVKVIKNRAVAIYHDGKIVMAGNDKNDRIANKFNSFIESNGLNGKVLAAVGDNDYVLILTTDGKLYNHNLNMFGKLPSGKMDTDEVILTDWKKDLDRIINVAKYEKERIERAERQAAEYRSRGVCQYCGGEFKKVILLGYRCVACGKRKDY